MNFLYTAKPDGLAIGIVDLNVPFYQLSGEGAEQGVRYDVNKMHWLGSPTVLIQPLAAHQRAGATPSDLSSLATREVKMANTSAGDSPHVIQAVLNGVFGWKLKPIFGYQGTQNRELGVMRGEVDGMVSTWDSFRRTMGDEFKAKNMLPLLAIGDLGNDPLLDGVSTLDKLVATKTAEDKALVDLAVRRYDWGRPMVAPPDTPANVVATIRAAVSLTFADPSFLADAQQIELEVIPVSGDRVQELMTSFMKTPKPVLDRMQSLIDAEAGN